MHVSQTYELPRKTTELLHQAPSLAATRLIHGLLCFIYNRVGPLRAVRSHLAKDNTCWAQDVACLTAAPGSNDLRWMRSAIDDLNGAGLFRTLNLEDRRLTFRLDRELLDSFPRSEKEGFAKMNSTDLARAASLEEAIFVTLVRLEMDKDWPKFELPIAPSEGHRSWDNSKKRWCNAIERVCNRFGHSYLVAPNQAPLADGVSKVFVKIQHAGTRWQPNKLYVFGAGTKRLIQFIPGQKPRTLTSKERAARQSYTTIR